MARIAVIPGDGIGIEVTVEALKVLHALADLAGKEIENRLKMTMPGRFLLQRLIKQKHLRLLNKSTSQSQLTPLTATQCHNLAI